MKRIETDDNSSHNCDRSHLMLDILGALGRAKVLARPNHVVFVENNLLNDCPICHFSHLTSITHADSRLVSENVTFATYLEPL